MGRPVDGESNPKWDEWANRPLSDAEKERILRAVKGERSGGGGGGSSSGCLLLILAALAVFVAVVKLL